MTKWFFTVSGTLRSNLDPFGEHDDARLWDALKRSYLVETTKPAVGDTTGEDSPIRAHTPTQRFTLDTPIEDEGANLSVGQVCVLLCPYRRMEDVYTLLATAFVGVACSGIGEGYQGVDTWRGNCVGRLWNGQEHSGHYSERVPGSYNSVHRTWVIVCLFFGL